MRPQEYRHWHVCFNRVWVWGSVWSGRTQQDSSRSDVVLFSILSSWWNMNQWFLLMSSADIWNISLCFQYWSKPSFTQQRVLDQTCKGNVNIGPKQFLIRVYYILNTQHWFHFTPCLYPTLRLWASLVHLSSWGKASLLPEFIMKRQMQNRY